MYCHNLTWLTHVTCKRALFCFCYHSSFNFMIYLKSVWINWLFVPNERQMWCQCSVMVMMMPIWGVMVFICRQSETARPRACHSLYNASTLLHTARSATHCTMTLHTTQLIITLHGDWLHCIVQQCVQTGRHTVLLSHSVQLLISLRCISLSTLLACHALFSFEQIFQQWFYTSNYTTLYVHSKTHTLVAMYCNTLALVLPCCETELQSILLN